MCSQQMFPQFQTLPARPSCEDYVSSFTTNLQHQSTRRFWIGRSSLRCGGLVTHWSENVYEELATPSPNKVRKPSIRSECKDRLRSVRRSFKHRIARVRLALSSDRPRKGRRSLPVHCRAEPLVASSPDASRFWLPPPGEMFESPAGKVLSHYADGTKLILLQRKPNQRFGIYVQRCLNATGQLCLRLSQMENENVERTLNGVLNVGDELVSVERRLGSKMSLEDLKAMVAKRSSLRIRVRTPFRRTIETEV